MALVAVQVSGKVLSMRRRLRSLELSVGSVERRRRLPGIARHYDVLVVEDESFDELRCRAAPLKSLAAQ